MSGTVNFYPSNQSFPCSDLSYQSVQNLNTNSLSACHKFDRRKFIGWLGVPDIELDELLRFTERKQGFKDQITHKTFFKDSSDSKGNYKYDQTRSKIS